MEGKFGEGKRKRGLGRNRARGAKTSLAVIAIQFLVMNLERRLQGLFPLFSNYTIFYCLSTEGRVKILFSKP
ncbi:transposase [Paenibacillus puerhi]|uniref:transposase n=1 Tax=Paenibacillus puerhi TaxID=2692622 RepID=UPI0038B2B635